MRAALCILFCIARISLGQKVCMDSRNHKTAPGPEDDLHGQCTPWKREACCTGNTTRDVHNKKMYGFAFDFCGRNMSAACRRHFHRDLCFYECEPNLGPWIVKVNRSFSRERFFEVPLCQSDCDAWWKDCRDDWACVRNWPREFKWKKGVNTCPAECIKMGQLYSNASDFCSQVWDYSWKVVPDKMPCMRMWFDGSQGNPNEAVAKLYARTSSSSIASCSTPLLFIILFVALKLNVCSL